MSDHTRYSGLFGEGIQYSLSPPLHETEAAALGLRLKYLVFDAAIAPFDREDLQPLLESLSSLGFAGVNVTVPFKSDVASALDRVEPSALAVSAVNTVVFTPDGPQGYNTDIHGFTVGLRDAIGSIASDRVIQFGAGGAGAGTGYAALAAGASALAIVDPAPARAESLAAQLRRSFPDSTVAALAIDEVAAAIPSADGVVNASVVGSPQHPGSPFDVQMLHDGLWVADVHYTEPESELLRAARSRELRVVGGGPMLVHQAARSFELFHGIAPDAERMWTHFLRLTSALET